MVRCTTRVSLLKAGGRVMRGERIQSLLPLQAERSPVTCSERVQQLLQTPGLEISSFFYILLLLLLCYYDSQEEPTLPPLHVVNLYLNLHIINQVLLTN